MSAFNSQSNKIALICGVSGQDGCLLANFLLQKGYVVWGTSRDAEGSSLENLVSLGISEQVKKITMLPDDFKSVLGALRKSGATEIYFLAGQTSVGLSFDLPNETINSNLLGVLNLLEASRELDYSVRIFHAGSSECYGNTDSGSANEDTPFRPRSPYAIAKASAIWLVDNYRESYGIHACSGILFNHESLFRPDRFVTKKIINAAKSIAVGRCEKLYLGNVDVSRDWGWAPEYVEAMWLMLQRPVPENFVIATGETNSLRDFVAVAFREVGLDWEDHVELSMDHRRPTDISISRANPEKAALKLGWIARKRMADVISEMVQNCS